MSGNAKEGRWANAVTGEETRGHGHERNFGRNTTAICCGSAAFRQFPGFPGSRDKEDLSIKNSTKVRSQTSAKMLKRIIAREQHELYEWQKSLPKAPKPVSQAMSGSLCKRKCRVRGAKNQCPGGARSGGPRDKPGLEPGRRVINKGL